MSRAKTEPTRVQLDEDARALVKGLRENGLIPESLFGPREEREPEEEIEP